METALIDTQDSLPIDMIIDTDIGDDIDDALALAYAALHPRINLLGVTTVYGDAPRRAQLAHCMFHAIGLAHIPCVAGESAIIGPDLTHTSQPAAYWGNQYAYCDKHDAARFRPRTDAIEFIRTALRRAPGPVALVGIGPATNLARLIQLDRALVAEKADLYLMAANLHSTRPEYNVQRDAGAFQVLLEAGLPLTLAPYESTDHLTDMQIIEQLGKCGRTGEVLLDLHACWRPYRHDKHEAVLYDLAAVMLPLALNWLQYEIQQVKMDATTGVLLPADGGASINFLRQVDHARFFNDFYATLRQEPRKDSACACDSMLSASLQ
jgi:purine nucleosidase/pyrimidine-specific ribonucleoside hydrolase